MIPNVESFSFSFFRNTKAGAFLLRLKILVTSTSLVMQNKIPSSCLAIVVNASASLPYASEKVSGQCFQIK
jgi:hypothetical protein